MYVPTDLGVCVGACALGILQRRLQPGIYLFIIVWQNRCKEEKKLRSDNSDYSNASPLQKNKHGNDESDDDDDDDDGYHSYHDDHQLQGRQWW